MSVGVGVTKIDLACFNAGRGGSKGDVREETKDGIEAIVHVNTVSHFLLAAELMPLLQGAQIRLMGLQRRSDLNGTRGLLVTPGERNTILTIPGRCLLSVRSCNLELYSDKQISVCAGCRQDFWSWETHGGWAGWTKASAGKRRKYLCPRCGVDDAQGSSWASAGAGTGPPSS